MEMTLPESHRLLIDCLRKDGGVVESCQLSGLSREHWQALLATASTQRMRPLLWHRFREKGLHDAVPLDVAEALQSASRRNTLHNMRLYGELHALLSALRSEGIPLILLKGIFLADAVYDHIGLREMSDIDVLARINDLGRIAEILTGMGYEPAGTVSEDTILKTHHHLRPMVKTGYASFEIHWNLTVPGTYYCSIDPDDLWERAISVHSAGGDAMALSPEDLLLHLCIHASYQHRFSRGLPSFHDIAETISRLGPALHWEVLVERTVLRGWQRGVYLALRLAGELSGAKVPMDIQERLRPADLTDDIVETAFALLLTDTGSSKTISVSCAKFLESRRLRDKIRIFWQRVFLSKAVIATQYSVPMDSVRIYGCYPRRIIDLLRRHGHTLRRSLEKDTSLISHVERTNRIADWLSGKRGAI